MLHRSFKPAKCKILLKLAVSRIKLMKNKREAHVKQLKKEIAHLLESGLDRTARIRVEHVVKEEKASTAYELIEIYCELIEARLSIIESQKNCPIDLKEAIAGVIFATPRCADIPELKDVRKQLKAKYGKEFISAAVELRPNCGVSQMLVEKLSARAPDGQAKIKILTAIAKEYNVKWKNPESSGETEPKPVGDLQFVQSEPISFAEGSKLQAEPSSVHVSNNHNEKATTLSDSYLTELRGSGDGFKTVQHSHPCSEDRNPFPSGSQNWNMEFKDATEAAQAAAKSAEQASMAARAAAELSGGGKTIRRNSSESKKFFANSLSDQGPQGDTRSKLEYGERISGQHYTESHKLVADSLRNQVPQRDASSKSIAQSSKTVTGYNSTESHNSFGYDFRDQAPYSELGDQHLAKNPADDDCHGTNDKMHSEKLNDNEPNNLDGVGEKIYGEGSISVTRKLAPAESDTACVDNSVMDVPSRENRSSKQKAYGAEENTFSGQAIMNEESRESGLDFVRQDRDGIRSENLGEATRNDQFTTTSISSFPSILVDNHDVVSNLDQHELWNDAEENPFSVIDKGNINKDIEIPISHAAVSFDDSGSEDGDYGFGAEKTCKEHDSSSFFSAQGRTSPSYESEVTSSWSPTPNTDDTLPNLFSEYHSSTQSIQPLSHLVFSESSQSSVVPSKVDDLLPVTFDDSDDMSSEKEEELRKSQPAGSKAPAVFSSIQDVYSRHPEPAKRKEFSFVGSNRKGSSQPSLYDSELVKVRDEKNQDDYSVGSETTSVQEGFPSDESSPRVKSTLLLNELDFYSVEDDGMLSKSQEFSRLSEAHKEQESVHITEIDSKTEDVELIKEPSLESEKELNFEMLKGGLRNKGFRSPMFGMSISYDASLSKQGAENGSSRPGKSSNSSVTGTTSASEAPTEEPNSQERGLDLTKCSSTSFSVTYIDSSTGTFENYPPRTSIQIQEPSKPNAISKVHTRSSTRVPITYFDSDSGESEEDHPKENLARRYRSSGAVSRRTKGSASNVDGSSLKAAVLSPSADSNYNAEQKLPLSPSEAQPEPQPRKPSDSTGSPAKPESVEQVASVTVSRRSSDGVSSSPTETQPKPQSQTRSDPRRSKKPESVEQVVSVPESRISSSPKKPESVEQVVSVPESRISSSPKKPESVEQVVSVPESRISSSRDSLKSSGKEQEPTSRKTSGTVGSSRTSSSGKESLSKENSSKHASHVHPKLPDYDAITAHLESIRRNRQK